MDNNSEVALMVNSKVEFEFPGSTAGFGNYFLNFFHFILMQTEKKLMYTK